MPKLHPAAAPSLARQIPSTYLLSSPDPTLRASGESAPVATTTSPPPYGSPVSAAGELPPFPYLYVSGEAGHRLAQHAE